MNNPLVSAVITTHNRKELLMGAIESVLNQTYNNIECIVVNDASIDGTEEYIKSYIRKGLIKYVFISSSESKGGNYARNVGINHATGMYVAFLDDDDEWLNTKIEKQIEDLGLNKEAEFAYCGMIIEENFDKSNRKPQSNFNLHLEGDLSKEILIHIITNTSAILVNRDLLLRIGGFDENLRYWQEYELCIRIMQETNVVLSHDYLVLYRVVKKDRNRLSNNLEGWEQAVSYIENKHKDLFDTLTKDEEGTRKLYIYLDGFLRAKSMSNYRYMLKYLIKTLSNGKSRMALIRKIISKIKHKE